MGRIKESIISKRDRATSARPVAPSVRRFRREMAQGKWLFRKNNRFLKKNMTPQLIEARVVFTPKGKNKKNIQSAPLSSVRGRKLIQMENDGLGKVKVIPRKTIWHEKGINV